MKRITIGRSSMNDVNINDPYVSRQHCQIIQNDDGDYILIDKSSANGTFVNGVKIQGEVNLNPNDIVRIGNTILPWSTYFMDNNIGEKKRAFMYKRVIVFFLVVSVCVIGVRSCSKEKELGNIKNENEELHAKNKTLNDSIDVLNDSIGGLNNKIGVLSNANEALNETLKKCQQSKKKAKPAVAVPKDTVYVQSKGAEPENKLNIKVHVERKIEWVHVNSR